MYDPCEEGEGMVTDTDRRDGGRGESRGISILPETPLKILKGPTCLIEGRGRHRETTVGPRQLRPDTDL